MDPINSARVMYIVKNYIDDRKTEEYGKCLKNSTDFKNFESNLQRAVYTDIEDFSTDIENLVRNVKKGKNSIQIEAANMLLDNWYEEYENIRKCTDCYYYWLKHEIDPQSEPHHFTLLCSKPHLLVYVRESRKDGLRWWPAKVLSVNSNREKRVEIECFGDHLREEYKFVDCILYSDTMEDLKKKAQIAMKSKNPVKNEEYKRAFKEVKKYIERIKQKYGERSFIPAAKGRKITDVARHSKEMYPAAFANGSRTKIMPQATVVDTQRRPKIEPQGTIAYSQYDANNIDETVSGTISPASHGYASQVYDSDDLEDSFDQIQPETSNSNQPAQLRIIQIKGEYSQFNVVDEPDTEPQAEDSVSRKRRVDNSAVKPVAKRMTRAASGKVVRANDDRIIDVEDLNASTTSQNHEEQNSATDEEYFATICEKYGEIDEKIEKFRQKLNNLNEQKKSIPKKIALAKNDKNRSVTLVKAYSEINKKIKRYGEEKEKLEQRRDEILAKF